MKKYIMIFLIFFTITTSLLGSHKVIEIRSDDVLNVREGSSTSTKIIGKLSYDAVGIEVVECRKTSRGSTWCKVKHPSVKMGWVSQRYITPYKAPKEVKKVKNEDNTITIIIIFIIVIWFWVWIKNGRKRKLMRKYDDKDTVDALINGHFWQDGTKEMLIDALGEPEDIDTKIYKTKTKEIWKYEKKGKNSYGLKIILEDNIIVGWEN